MSCDEEYVPEDEETIIRRGPKSKRKYVNKTLPTSVLSQIWPKVKRLTLKGLQPKDIEPIVNRDLPLKSHVDNKQISNLIHRKKKEGELSLPVAKTAGGLRASTTDCMCKFKSFILVITLTNKPLGRNLQSH